MLNKMKTMYKEWKEIVGLLAFAITGIIVVMLIDTMPALALGITLTAGAIGLALITEG